MKNFMAITVFPWLAIGVLVVHRIRYDFYVQANWTIKNGVSLGQTTELYCLGECLWL